MPLVWPNSETSESGAKTQPSRESDGRERFKDDSMQTVCSTQLLISTLRYNPRLTLLP